MPVLLYRSTIWNFLLAMIHKIRSCNFAHLRGTYTSVYHRCVRRNCEQGTVKMTIRHSVYANFKSLYAGRNDTTWWEVCSQRRLPGAINWSFLYTLIQPVMLYCTEYKSSTTVKHNTLIFVTQCYMFRLNEPSSSGTTLQTFKRRNYTCAMYV
jgi:hypothetical protein